MLVFHCTIGNMALPASKLSRNLAVEGESLTTG